MTDNVEELVERARKLPPAERARLVQGILQTLDQPDAALDAEWREEVERRIDGAEAGDRPATPWSEARRRLGL
jgi:putative addiction module component (TIGR02574 family)